MLSIPVDRSSNFNEIVVDKGVETSLAVPILVLSKVHECIYDEKK